MVFRGAQDEKREVKLKIKHKVKDLLTSKEAENSLFNQIEKIKNSPDWKKLKQKNEKELLNTNRDLREFYKKK